MNRGTFITILQDASMQEIQRLEKFQNTIKFLKTTRHLRTTVDALTLITLKRVIWTSIIELHIREQQCQVFLEEVHPGVLVV